VHITFLTVYRLLSLTLFHMTLMLIFDFQFFVKSVISYKNDNTDSDFGTLILIYNRIIAYIVVVGLLLDGRLVVLKDSDG
jgi:hypothetical protein